MNLIDRVLLEWSYKTSKGYPDINSQEDMSLFESMFGFNLQEILDKGYRALKFSELIKRGGPRLVKFYDMVKAGKPFFSSNGNEIKITFASEEYATLFNERDVEGIKKIAGGKVNNFPFFLDSKKNSITLNDLLKTPDFGGKGAGSGTVVEDENLYILKKKLDNLIGIEGGTIDVIVGSREYKISGAETQPGMPKSDFNLLDEKGTPVVFISHKKAGGKGATADDFIRWSGYTMYASHPEVETFNTSLKQFLIDNKLEGLPNKTRFISSIKDKELIRKLIYGPEYGGPASKENCNIIIQGEVEFENKGSNKYKLSGEHVLLPPNTPKGEYEPYLTAGYRGDRQMFGILNNEAIAMTKAIANRASNVYLLKGSKFEKIK